MLSSGKIDKYEYFKDEQILSSDKSRIIEQAKSTYSPLGKAFKKQINSWRSRNTTSRSFKSFKTQRKSETELQDYFQNK